MSEENNGIVKLTLRDGTVLNLALKHDGYSMVNLIAIDAEDDGDTFSYLVGISEDGTLTRYKDISEYRYPGLRINKKGQVKVDH